MQAVLAKNPGGQTNLSTLLIVTGFVLAVVAYANRKVVVALLLSGASILGLVFVTTVDAVSLWDMLHLSEGYNMWFALLAVVAFLGIVHILLKSNSKR